MTSMPNTAEILSGVQKWPAPEPSFSLLGVRDLAVSFDTPEGEVPAVNKINLQFYNNERLAIVGETGCGKSVFALSLMGMLPGTARVSGSISFRGQELLQNEQAALRQLRGREIVLLPQNPAASLNPVFTVGYHLRETLIHVKGRREARKENLRHSALRLLEKVGFKDLQRIYNAYPHQLSGGMKQRVLLAISAAGNPSLLIADEPTKGLDDSVKKKNLLLLQKITRSKSMVLITHDLETAAICDNIAVMYAGEIVEWGRRDKILNRPLHPYTRGLLDSLPEKGMTPIKGSTPGLLSLPEGCRFHPRCSQATAGCASQHPPLAGVFRDHYARCLRLAAR